MTDLQPGTPNGWEHSAETHHGHYWDDGVYACRASKAFDGDLDIRPDPPVDACAECARVVKRHGGSIKQEHHWRRLGTFGRDSYMCRCGAKRPGVGAS